MNYFYYFAILLGFVFVAKNLYDAIQKHPENTHIYIGIAVFALACFLICPKLGEYIKKHHNKFKAKQLYLFSAML